MIHLFKASDGSWIYTGTTVPSNMEGSEYVEGVLPEGEAWDYEYEYTCVNGVAVKGNKVTIPDLPEEPAYIEQRKNEYPSIDEQLDMQYWDSVNGTTTWKDAIKAVKDKYPKE